MPRNLSDRPLTDPEPAVAAILEIVEGFCRDHLNSEYADLCRRLTDKLARKRPSPLSKGKANVWACAIIRTIGWINFLDDKTQQPHMKLTAIDNALGVGESTAQGKAKLIRDLLRIQPMDKDWTLPSLMDQNPMVWLVQVNGFVMDIRTLPRETQEIAFEKGMIPYIPADREEASPPPVPEQNLAPSFAQKRKSITPDSSQRSLFE